MRTETWKPRVTEFLQNYWVIPPAINSALLFELLHKRKMRTKLNICTVVRDSELHLKVRAHCYQQTEEANSTPTKEGERRFGHFNFGIMCE